jgi:hypothetical protein
MSIANPEQLALESPNLGLTSPAPTTNVAKRRYHKVITKLLIGAAIAIGAGVVGAAPASAEPNVVGGEPNPYGTLGCNCRETAPPGSPDRMQEIDRGLWEGHTAVLPGLPGPAQPGQPLP